MISCFAAMMVVSLMLWAKCHTGLWWEPREKPGWRSSHLRVEPQNHSSFGVDKNQKSGSRLDHGYVREVLNSVMSVVFLRCSLQCTSWMQTRRCLKRAYGHLYVGGTRSSIDWLYTIIANNTITRGSVWQQGWCGSICHLQRHTCFFCSEPHCSVATC